MVDAHSTPCWTGEPFSAQIRRLGQIGLLERGAAGDVPPELVALATGMWAARVTGCAFVWNPPGAYARPCRVTMELRRDGAFEYVALEGDPVDELPHHLSARELEVLTLVVAGLSNATIAKELWISSGTAAAHVNKVLQKLELSTRTAAATYALDNGLLQVPLPGSSQHYANLSVGKLCAASASDRARALRSVGRVASPTGGRRRVRELVVGAVLPSTGKGSDDGTQMHNGLQLAIEEINGAGGIRGRTVRAAVVDVDVTSSTSIQSSFQTLLRQGVDVLTSGYLVDQGAAHEIAAESGVPYLHAATSRTMEQAVQDDIHRYGNVFQVCASDTMYAPTFVSYMTHLRDQTGWESPSQRLVVLKKGWHHVDFGIEEAIPLAAQNGWQLDVVPVTGPENGDGWMRAMATALREPAAAAMIGSYFTADAVQAISALRGANSSTLAYAIYSPSVPTFREELGSAAEGVLWATMTGTYSDSIGIAFARRYRHRFGVDPGRSHAGLAYDRMQRIALAWRLTGDLADGDDIASNMRSQLYRGVNGTYNFDTPGQAARGFEAEMVDPSLAQPQLIFQIQDGKHVIVEGGPFRTGRFRDTDRHPVGPRR